jgi:hypothetical protein
LQIAPWLLLAIVVQIPCLALFETIRKMGSYRRMTHNAH